MITLSGICKIFRTNEIETHALSDINLQIVDNDFISIIGPSGCGKSTLLNVIGLLDTPTKGQLKIEGIETLKMKDKELANLRNEKFGFIFQSFHLLPSLNILQNVELPLLYSKRNLSSKDIRELAMMELEKVGLSPRMNHFPAQLSGGQCQRAAIARAIITNPLVLLADEPTGNLDSKMGGEIMSLLLKLNEEGTSIVMVTHDNELAREAKTQIMMSDGEIKNRINL